MMAGAMMLRVDILTAPRSETKRSSHGTVAARATMEETMYSKAPLSGHPVNEIA